jgi:hypothetical protein
VILVGVTRRLQICAVALALGGCDVVFGLDRTNLPVDAAVSIDAPTKCGANEHDEDGDGVADRCDPCPYVVDTGGDSDGDGVGDLCDPEQEGENHQLAFFGFDAIPSELKLFNEGAGNWAIDNDRLAITGVVGGDYLARLDVMRQAVTVRTRVTVFALQSTVGSRSAGLWADIDTTSTHEAFPAGFVFEQVDVSSKQFAHIVEVGTVNENGTESQPFHFESGRSYELTLTCTMGPPTCFGTGLTEGQAGYSVSIDQGTGRAGSVGLRVHGDVMAVFDWLVVYSAKN